MKRIYSAILSFAAVLCFVPVASAQSYTRTYPGVGSLTFKGDPNDYGTNPEVGFSKHISTPVDGTYWIKLEAFVHGSATKTSTPADFVLVLDLSGSMDDPMGTGQGTRLAALKSAVNSFITQVDKNDKMDMGGNLRTRRVGNKISIVTFSTDAKVESELIPLGSNPNDSTGLLTLKRLVRNFDADGGTYAHKGMQEAYRIANHNDNSRKLRTVVLFTDGDPGIYASWTSTDRMYEYNYGEGVLAFIEDYEYYYGTPYGYATRQYDTFMTANETIKAANDIKNIGTPTNGITSNVFTVSIINNPSNQTQVYLGKTSSNWIGADNMGWRTDNWSTSLDNCWNYNHNGNVGTRSSSEINFALSATTADELTAAFDAIAGLSGNPNNEELTSSASTIDVVSSSFDLSGTITPSTIKVYTAPYLYDKNKEEKLYFGSEVLAPNSKDKYDEYVYSSDGKTYNGKKDVDDLISVNAQKLQQNIIQVDGFDYTNNWCGPITEDTNLAGAHGHKVVILIPIKMSDSAVGGPNVVTNAEGSGIFKKATDTVPIVKFTSPTVSLPVNLSIKKTNLGNGENAKFVIQRAIATEQRPADADATWHPDYASLTGWEYVTSVFFPNKNGSDEVKIKGLPSTPDNEGYYVYRVIEEDWSWTYTFQSASGEGYVKENDKVVVKNKTISDKFGVYTDQFVKNPITFTNQYEVDSDKRVRHAESKVTNTFVPKTTGSTEGTVTTSDSKGNDR